MWNLFLAVLVSAQVSAIPPPPLWGLHYLNRREGPRALRPITLPLPPSQTSSFAAAGDALGVSARPSLSYSTYLGGSGSDVVTGLAVDGTGSLYVTGYTNSADLPKADSVQSTLTAGSCGSGPDTYQCFDAFVAKLDPTGRRLVYVAYFGGSGDDFATTIAVDATGNAYIAGYTNSVDLHTTSAAQSVQGGGDCGVPGEPKPCFDAFVAKLNSSGSSWIYATYLGGSGDDLAQGIAVDAAGNAVIAGTTTSANFPTRRALQGEYGGEATEGFVAKLDASGSQLTFATFLGGSRDDFGTSVALDAAGDIFVAGYTNSPDLPATAGPQPGYAGGPCGALASIFPCFDAFVAKLASDGSGLAYLTYLGGTGGDYANGIAVDDEGRATIVGMTTSQDFPVTYGSFQISGGGNNTDAFVARLDPSGDSFLYSTYLGGGGADSATSVAIDDIGRAYVAGTTYGSAFPVINPVQNVAGGFYDAFLAVLNDGGTALEFATNLGGTAHDKGHCVAVDRFANAYVAGETISTDYLTARPMQAAYGGGAFDGVITKVALGNVPILYAAPAGIDFGNQRLTTTSEPRNLQLVNIGGSELQLQDVETTGDFASVGACPNLAGGASCEMPVVFTPMSKGRREGALTIEDNGLGGTTEVRLTGVGVAPEIHLSASQVIFEPQLVGSESGPRDITLMNPGSDSLELSGIDVRGDFIQSNDCPPIIPVGQGCIIQVRFSPKSAGSHAGMLAVTNSLPEESKDVVLSGSGTDFSLQTPPSRITLAAGESAAITVTIVPLGGSHETLSLACTGAPKEASCTVSPQSIRLDGSNSALVKVTISTTARATAPVSLHQPRGPALPLAIVCLLAALLASQCSSKRMAPLRLTLRIACIMTLLLNVAACGGGGGGLSSRPPATPQGTPAGTYALTMTATCGTVSKSSPISLVVR
ncbi:MAG: SBBP repeat-containing protein [Acidobacteria bacterium]|nr:SBBP repeat-containing protein [Acidobacteriota bacterium]